MSGMVLREKSTVGRFSAFGRGVATALVVAALLGGLAAPARAFDREAAATPHEARTVSLAQGFVQSIFDFVDSILSDAGILIDPNGSPGSFDSAVPPPSNPRNSEF